MTDTARNNNRQINVTTRYLIWDKNNPESFVLWDKNNPESYIVIESDTSTSWNTRTPVIDGTWTINRNLI